MKKQVEKVEKGRAIREELEGALAQYLATERAHLSTEDIRLSQANSLIVSKQKQLEDFLATLPEETAADVSGGQRSQLSSNLTAVREKRRGIETRMSRLEGMIEAQRHMLHMQAKHVQHADIAVTITAEKYQEILADVEVTLRSLREAETLEMAKAVVRRIEVLLTLLKAYETDTHDEHTPKAAETAIDTGIKDTALELEDLERELKTFISQEQQIQQQLQALEQNASSRCLLRKQRRASATKSVPKSSNANPNCRYWQFPRAHSWNAKNILIQN